MPVTICVNKLSVSHKGSTGTSIAFPDVCKTPTPGGPIPIPYPNIVMSSDTTSGSSTVKLDGNEIMLKEANMKMSTGDEAGSAMGVVSNKIKGKAEFVNYSFDVKVDGKNVCRLSDPTQQNMGSANTAAFFHAQSPVVPIGPQLEGCQKTEKKQEEQKIDEETAWKESGVDPAHKQAFQTVADEKGVIIYIRKSNKHCSGKGWIKGKHKPKPHEVLAAKTIAEKNAIDCQIWIDGFFAEGKFEREMGARPNVWKAPPTLPHDAKQLYGVVMSLNADNLGEPLVGYGSDSNGYSYKGKWITGDYDLQDVVYVGGDCRRPEDTDAEEQFGGIQRLLNKYMGWDGIQHGPQSLWVETMGNIEVDMPKAVDAWLKAPSGTPVKKVKITETRELPVMDKELTVVAPAGTVMKLKDEEDAKNALICCGCGGS